MASVPVGNRFLVYTMYIEAHSEVRIFKGKMGNIVIAAGHSIFNRSCSVNIGELMSSYGGGGHFGAGSCQIPTDTAKNVIKDTIDTLNG